MYTLILADGTTIENLVRLNPCRFMTESDVNLYDKLDECNLSFITLLKDGVLKDVFLNCKL